MSGLDWPGAITDVKACAAWLKANGCNKVVVAGFCMGGALALGSTVQVDGVDACIAFYGWNKQLGDVSTVNSHPFCVCGAPRSCPCSNVRVNLCGDEEGRVGIETRTWLGWRELNCIHFTQCGGGSACDFLTAIVLHAAVDQEARAMPLWRQGRYRWLQRCCRRYGTRGASQAVGL